MSNAMDGNGILVFLDRDLKAPQPALTKGLKLARAAGLPLTVMVNSDSAAMRRAVGLDEERRQAAEKQIRKAWDKRIDALCGDHQVDKRIVSSRDSEQALRDTVRDCRPVLSVVHTSEEGRLRRHLFTLFITATSVLLLSLLGNLLIKRIRYPFGITKMFMFSRTQHGREILTVRKIVVRHLGVATPGHIPMALTTMYQIGMPDNGVAFLDQPIFFAQLFLLHQLVHALFVFGVVIRGGTQGQVLHGDFGALV